MSNLNILVVEDSPEYQAIISKTLGYYNLTTCSTAEEASSLIKQAAFSLLLIDINLPHRDGFALLTEIRSHPTMSSVPVLCLTGRKEITDKVTAFSLGADDYVTKPFDPLELRARVDAKIKNLSRIREEKTFTNIGDFEIDHLRHRVAINSNGQKTEVPVTQTEFKLLCCLARRPEQVFTRDQLLVAAWGEDARVLDRVVDVHVCLLRKKLGDRSHYIKAVTGVGYKLVPNEKRKKAV